MNRDQSIMAEFPDLPPLHLPRRPVMGCGTIMLIFLVILSVLLWRSSSFFTPCSAAPSAGTKQALGAWGRGTAGLWGRGLCHCWPQQCELERRFPASSIAAGLIAFPFATELGPSPDETSSVRTPLRVPTDE